MKTTLGMTLIGLMAIVMLLFGAGVASAQASVEAGDHLDPVNAPATEVAPAPEEARDGSESDKDNWPAVAIVLAIAGASLVSAVALRGNGSLRPAGHVPAV
jgi:hypothetical protein